MVKSDKCMGVFQLLGEGAQAAPKVYAYEVIASFSSSLWIAMLLILFLTSFPHQQSL